MNRFYHIFFTAVGFFTKIPIPKSVDFEKVKQGEATLLLPVIGYLVGGFAAIVFVLSAFVFPLALSVAFALLSGIYVTSAFHEDGLADMADGFGGGWTKKRILEIMKDSSIGTYGVLALTLSLGIKYLTLINILNIYIPITIFAGHTLSRALAVSLMYDMEYARVENSKAKSYTKKISVLEMLIIIFAGFVPLFFFNNQFVFLSVIPLAVTREYLKKLYKKWINGYTGDCIGAAQQIFEIVFLLTILAIDHSELA